LNPFLWHAVYLLRVGRNMAPAVFLAFCVYLHEYEHSRIIARSRVTAV